MAKSIDLRDSKYPELFEPVLTSLKKKPSNKLFSESSNNIHIIFEDNDSNPLQLPIRRRPVLKRRHEYQFPCVSVLGKRKLEMPSNNDKERYRQENSQDLFSTNVFYNDKQCCLNNSYKAKINYWRKKYLTK